jgi:tetratricopeptide (TPR) repeat protein
MFGLNTGASAHSSVTEIVSASPLESSSESLFRLILPHLARPELGELTVTSKEMQTKVVTVVRDSKLLPVENFVNLLIRRLDETGRYPEQGSVLKTIYEEIVNVRFSGLVSQERYILELEERLFNVLKQIDQNTLGCAPYTWGPSGWERPAECKSWINPPELMRHIFSLAGVQRQFDEANRDPGLRRQLLENVSNNFAELGRVDIAIRVALSIDGGGGTSQALRNIAEKMFKKKNFALALRVAQLIPHTYNQLKGTFLGESSKALAKSGNSDFAVKFYQAIPDRDSRELYALGVAEALMKAGMFVNAINFFELLDDQFDKTSFLCGMSEQLIKIEDFDTAIEVVKLMPQVNRKKECLHHTSKSLFDSGDIDKAIEVAQMIVDDFNDGIGLFTICSDLLEANDIGRASTVARLLPIDGFYNRAAALGIIRDAMHRAGDVQGAALLSNRIQSLAT